MQCVEHQKASAPQGEDQEALHKLPIRVSLYLSLKLAEIVREKLFKPVCVGMV